MKKYQSRFREASSIETDSSITSAVTLFVAKYSKAGIDSEIIAEELAKQIQEAILMLKDRKIAKAYSKFS